MGLFHLQDCITLKFFTRGFKPCAWLFCSAMEKKFDRSELFLRQFVYYLDFFGKKFYTLLKQ